MGNLAFDIIKDVDLNKVVNLDIDKNVDVEVNNDDILATAEADAEAFGERALAETDAYTYVNEGEDRTITRIVPKEVDVDALGNTTLTEQDDFINDVPFDLDDDGVTDVTYFVPENITVNFDTPDNTGLPDIDDLNWTGGLEGNDTIPGADTLLPTEGFAANDKNLIYADDQPNGLPSAVLEADGSVVVTARYELANDWVVDFSPPDRIVNGNEATQTDSLSMVIPQGTTYLVEFLDEDGDINTGVEGFEAKEYEFEAFPETGRGQWVFGSNSFDIETYVQTGEEIFDIGFGDWAFEALGIIDITVTETVPGIGEAFSYAESTAALDLNGDDNVIPVPTEVL